MSALCCSISLKYIINGGACKTESRDKEILMRFLCIYGKLNGAKMHKMRIIRKNVRNCLEYGARYDTFNR